MSFPGVSENKTGISRKLSRNFPRFSRNSCEQDTTVVVGVSHKDNKESVHLFNSRDLKKRNELYTGHESQFLHQRLKEKLHPPELVQFLEPNGRKWT